MPAPVILYPVESCSVVKPVVAAKTLPIFWITAAFLAIFAFQFARSMNRHDDPDEYQFTAPPVLLAHFHELPYVDYPYFHMPNLVFLQAVLMSVSSQKLMVARSLSALCGTATICLVFFAGWSILKNLPISSRRIFCYGLTLIFATCRLFTYTSGNAWNHDTAVLCTLGAYILHVRGVRLGKLLPILFAGFLVGFAVGIRLSFALAVVPFAVFLATGQSPMNRRYRAIALVGSIAAAAIANIPSAYLAYLAPRQFVFGNIGYCKLSTAYYHSLPNVFGLTLLTKIGSSLSKFSTDPCNLFILIAFCLAIVLWFSQINRSRKSPPANSSEFYFTLGILFFLWIGAMGPSPMMQQYNYMLVPFMVLAIFYSISLLDPHTVEFHRLCKITATTTLVLGSIGAVRWYWSIIYLAQPDHWQPLIQHREANWIQANTFPGARILTIESEIPLEANLRIYPQYTTGRFVLLVERFETPELRKSFGLVGRDELPAILAAQPPDAVFVRSDHGPDRIFVDYAFSHRFSAVVAPDGISTLWLNPSLANLRPISRNKQTVAAASAKTVAGSPTACQPVVFSAHRRQTVPPFLTTTLASPVLSIAPLNHQYVLLR